LSVVALIEFYFKLIICITIPEEPELEEQYSQLLMRVDAYSPECLSLADSLEKEKSLERGIDRILEG
jgi:hypothetical protein